MSTASFLDGMADDIRWTITGTTKWSKTYDGKQSVLNDLLAPLRAQWADRFRATANRLIAEGEYVVAELRGHVTTKEGKLYDNQFCYIFRIVDGKVREITEYMDTAFARSVMKEPD